MSYSKYHVFGFIPKDENNMPESYNNSHNNSHRRDNMSYFDDFEDDYMSRLNSIEESKMCYKSERKKPDRKKMFSRGYKESRERLANNSYYTRSCFNCAYYFQASGDKEEVCQNTEVLEYDMVVDRNNIYCLKWQPSSSNKTEQQTLFKKNGRAKLD